MRNSPELQAFYDLKIIPILKTHTVVELCKNHTELVEELCRIKGIKNDIDKPFKKSKVKGIIYNLKSRCKHKITNVDNVIITKENKTIEKKTIKADNDITTTIISETEIKKEDARLYWKHPAHQKQDDLLANVLDSFIKQRDYLKSKENFNDNDYSVERIKKKHLQIKQLDNLLTKQINFLTSLQVKDIKFMQVLEACTNISEKIEKLEEKLLDTIKKIRRRDGIDLEFVDSMTKSLLNMNMSRRAMIENDQKMVEYGMIQVHSDSINAESEELKQIILDEYDS